MAKAIARLASEELLTGAEALMEALAREGVEHVFGHPGGAILTVYDKIRRVRGVRHILVRHEQVGAHAAEGYARAKGVVGCCMATSGPGATNLVTGIADAMLDSVPVVAITGQVPTTAIGSDAFQEADTFGITMPIVKHSFVLTDATRIPDVIHQAFHIAGSGRPGPVLVDIPKDISNAKYRFDFENANALPRGYRVPGKGERHRVLHAAEAIAAAKKPIIFTGGGAISSGAWAEVRRLAKKTNIPVTSTLLGLGAFPAGDGQWLGMPGMHGTVAANYALNFSDLIIGVGVRFDDRITGDLKRFAPGAKVVHIEVDPAELNKNVPAEIPILGDARTVLKQLLPHVRPPSGIGPWWKQIRAWEARFPLRYRMDSPYIKPQWAIQQIYEFYKDWDPIVTTGVGQHQMWAAQYFRFEHPRRFIVSGGLGTMGFGFPASIGAQVACPDKTVICIDGDGSFQMVLQDLATAVVNRLPLKIFLIDNQFLGMVRQWQELFYQKGYSNVCMWQTVNCDPWCNQPGPDRCPEPTPDFVKLAEAYGAVGIRVRRYEEMAKALKKSAEVADRPVLVDIMVDPEENCYPMIPAGQSVHELIPCPAR